jgi:fructokinase
MDNYIVGIGEVLWDHFEDKDNYVLGGAPFNFAYHVNQFGLNSLVISAIGNDKLGQKLEADVKKKNVPYMLERLNLPTGVVNVKEVDGKPRYDILTERAWDYIPDTEQLKEIAANTKAACFGSLAQRSETSRNSIFAFLDAMPSDALRIFDINLRQKWYTEEVIKTSLQKANVLKINDDELLIIQRMFGYIDITPENTCRLIMRDYQLDMLILTCGDKGSYIFTKDEMSYLSTNDIEVVDTVGAGDSFTASFIASMLKGKTIHEAHRIAVNVSAFVCTQAGATPIIPDKLKQ